MFGRESLSMQYPVMQSPELCQDNFIPENVQGFSRPGEVSHRSSYLTACGLLLYIYQVGFSYK